MIDRVPWVDGYREDGGHLFGLPCLSVLFLAVASLLGISLLVSALRRDRMVQRAADREPG